MNIFLRSDQHHCLRQPQCAPLYCKTKNIKIMATYSISQTAWVSADKSSSRVSVWQKFLQFADSQASIKTGWWVISLMIHSFLVPIAFLMAYVYEGPALAFLFISMMSFFVNFIANMGGASVRFTFISFLVSLVIHTAMIAVTLILFY